MSRPEKGLHFLMINPVLSLHFMRFLQYSTDIGLPQCLRRASRKFLHTRGLKPIIISPGVQRPCSHSPAQLLLPPFSPALPKI